MRRTQGRPPMSAVHVVPPLFVIGTDWKAPPFTLYIRSAEDTDALMLATMSASTVLSLDWSDVSVSIVTLLNVKKSGVNPLNPWATKAALISGALGVPLWMFPSLSSRIINWSTMISLISC